MILIYKGPRKSVNVCGFGEHECGEAKEYPDGFARQLMDSSHRQKFDAVGAGLKPEPTEGAGLKPAPTEPAPTDADPVSTPEPLKAIPGGKKKRADKP